MVEQKIRQVVGIGEMKVSNREDDVLVTYALGSCLGISIHDPVAKVGGLLHVMLPSSVNHAEKAAEKPHMFVDLGVPLLFKACYQAGGKRERLVVKVAGGAAIGQADGNDLFQIGKKNVTMLRKLFWKNGILIRAEDVEGVESRTLSLDVCSGEVLLKVGGIERAL
jgi:chemotaxis protein CheD